ncbi:hypothetical protein KUCAC02_018255 [Chaenocephalus aceratus]|uniref:Uncharacterized protein n=1 Tax=Chaenocephalus aceratus TaxID=36190 RepID=A0ACB9W891_CHAAC|nr:hypothetical protein KUCAC02_018255 [Chaenocephalus aceratus]
MSNDPRRHPHPSLPSASRKRGVSITIDDPVRTARQPSPPRGKGSSIVHISNLVRPFTLGQLKELLSRNRHPGGRGLLDRQNQVSLLRHLLQLRGGRRYSCSSPRDFCQQDELDFQKGLANRPGAEERGRASGLPSLFPEREQWAEREREMERREKARAERGVGPRQGPRLRENPARRRRETPRGHSPKRNAAKRGQRARKRSLRRKIKQLRIAGKAA